MGHARAALVLVNTALTIVACGSPSDTGSPGSKATPATTSQEASTVGTDPTPEVTSVTETNGPNPPSPLIVYQWGAPCGQSAPGDGLCLVSEDGSNAHAILTELGDLHDPDWSRDGDSLVFARPDPPGQSGSPTRPGAMFIRCSPKLSVAAQRLVSRLGHPMASASPSCV